MTRKAIIFARVSTKDQEEQGHSLPAQIVKLRQYAERHNLSVIKEYSFSESAGSKIRTKFEEVMTVLKKHNQENMPVLLCQNVDRLTRNFRDAVDLDDMRRYKGLEIHFVQDGFTISAQSSGNDMFMWEAKVFIAKQYLNRLSDDAKRSIKHKLEKGEWVGQAPIGYLNTRDDNDKATIILDPERFMLVRRLFTDYAKGIYSLHDVTRMSVQWGLRNKTKAKGKITVSQLHQMIQNPFYYGIMSYDGQLYPHDYPPIIDEQTFNRCQEIRLGWKKKPFKYSEKPFIFRGLLQCGHCGCAYSSETKKEKYTYLACTKNRDPHCSAPRVREEVIINQLGEVFDRMAFPQVIMEDIRKNLTKLHENKKEFHDASLQALQKEYYDTQKKLGILLDALLNESITQSEYDKKATELKQRQHEINQQLKNFESADEDFVISVKMLLELVNNAGKLFRSSNIEQKRKLISLVYQNLVLTNGKVDYTLRTPFELFLNNATCQAWLPFVEQYRTICLCPPASVKMLFESFQKSATAA